MQIARHALAALVLCSPALASVEREGEGPRREALNAMETQPFPAAALAALDAWTVERPLTPGDWSGRVALFVTLDSADPSSLMIASTAARMADRHGGDLVVIGVHPTERWDEAVLRAGAGVVRIPLARDAGGFRSGLRVDDEPDAYLIDRAGNLRYADITTASIAEAVDELIAETAEQAAGEAQRRADIVAAGGNPFAPEAVTAETITAAMIPASYYQEARWPEHNSEGLSAEDFQGKPLPAALGSENWINREAQPTSDRVLVLDFWATWCGPCRQSMPILERVQKKHEGELMVLGISDEKEEVVREFLKKGEKGYAILIDEKNTIAGPMRVQGIPHVVVLSTDGTVRWQGNPLDGEFVKAVDAVVKADPLFAARRGSIEIDTEAAAAAVLDNLPWPAHNDSDRVSGKDRQGESVRSPLAGVRWLDGKAPEDEGKVIVVDFWATWCGPCKAVSPKLDQLAKDLGDEIVLVGMSGQSEPIATVEAYVRQHPVAYRHAFSANQKLYKHFGVRGIPHAVVLSSDGVVRWQGHPGAGNFEQVIRQTIEADKQRKALAASNG